MPKSTIPLTLTPESGQIHGYGYDPASKRLHVAFKSNHERKTYEYRDVSQETADALVAAESKGRYVDKVVKANHDFDTMVDDEPKTEGGAAA